MTKLSLSLAVHMHLYYTEMWPELKAYLANIGDYPYDLYVTVVESNSELVEQVKAFKSDAKIKVVENRGYDVGPFVDFLHDIDLNKYDLILKIHTKSRKQGMDTTINGLRVSRKLWAKLLTRSLLGSHQLFRKNMVQFSKDPKLGMVGAKYLITSENSASITVRPQIDRTMKELGFGTLKEIRFLAGTMFFCRAKLLQPIKDKYELADFSPTDGKVKDGTLAHVLERLFGCVVTAQGYEIRGYDTWLSHKLAFEAFCRFIYQSKITNNHRHLIKVFRLPIYWQKVD